MNRTILFSPVGGTDPMPQTNWQDGSLLHIARVYKPDEIYLYMSAEILENHKKDNRYLYCLEKLAEKQNYSPKYHIIERGDLKNVHIFDYFYEDFRTIIRDITKDFDESDRLLLNISSGTPAMKSGLLVLATLGEFPYISVQVETPTGKMNEHRHENYDVELIWEGNEDNEEDFVNRCQEVRCPSLTEIKQEEIIKKLVSVYDYEAAFEIASGLKSEHAKIYLPLLELARARLQMDFTKVNALSSETKVDFIPMKSAEKQKYFEYALNMDIKRKKGEYTDFIRAITPLLVDLFALILKQECSIDINTIAKGHPLRWDKKFIQANMPDIDMILNEHFLKLSGRNFSYGEVYSSALSPIILEYAKNNKVKELISNLTKVEKEVRNPAAHEIVSLSDNKIRKIVGFSSEDIMKLIKDAFKYTGLGVSQKHWDSYEVMNEAIIKAIG